MLFSCVAQARWNMCHHTSSYVHVHPLFLITSCFPLTEYCMIMEFVSLLLQLEVHLKQVQLQPDNRRHSVTQLGHTLASAT